MQKKARNLSKEWLITNGLGGYSSSTTVGLNTRKYHGLLVSSDEKLERRVVLQKIEEELISGGKTARLSVNEYEDGTVYPKGYEFQTGFGCTRDRVSFAYSTPLADVVKTVSMPENRNAVKVNYVIKNKCGETLTFNAAVLGNLRPFHSLGGAEAAIELSDEKNIKACSQDTGIVIYSDKAFAQKPPYEWNKKIFYRVEMARGEAASEDVRCLGGFSLDVKAESEEMFCIVCAREAERDGNLLSATLKAGKSDKRPGFLSSLEIACRPFIVSGENFKTVVAGYHWFGEWGRDAMISLPGLTLVWGNTCDAGRILERFLSTVKDGRITTKTEGGFPVHYDYDASLWLVDRIFQYLKYAGAKESKNMITKNWKKISSIIAHYSSLEIEGIIRHKSGTWMDTLGRDNAVEVQGLYYNALNVYDRLAEIYGLKKPSTLDTLKLKEKFERSFLKSYWNGKFLNDTTQQWEKVLRPNQLIVTALDYGVLDKKQAAGVINSCKDGLLTRRGLRTLPPSDSRYRARYEGGFAERERAYHNGTVWPWLMGSYATSYVKVFGRGGAAEMKRMFEGFFREAMNEAGLGHVSEVFDAEAPHAPRGCIAQAWSIAEPVRSYFEDALGRRPPHEKEVF